MIRSIATIALDLILALTSGTMALARGQATAMGQMVICSGAVAVTVTVDAEGQPTGPTHLCPDCALSFFAVATPAPAALPMLADWQWLAFAAAPPFSASARPLPPPQARGPPSRI